MGRAGRAMVESLYDPAHHLAAMLDVYAQAARRAGRTLPSKAAA